jgi:hypothetical protein
MCQSLKFLICFARIAFERFNLHTQMRKLLPFLLLLPLAAPGFSQQRENVSSSATKAPSVATIEIFLIDAPGINDETSRWEINYKFGMTTEALLFEAHKRGDDDRIGDLIKEGSIQRPLKPKENRKIILRFPLNAEIQKLLTDQPSMPDQTSMTIEQSRDYEKHAQNFSFHSIVEIYDARLQRKVILPIGGAWPYVSYPDARFEINIKIDAKGDHVVNYPRPKGGSKTEIIKTHE